jgi:hypothetical protein
MQYDVLNIDGDSIGDYDGVLWIDDKRWGQPECWQYLKDWPYFKNIPTQMMGDWSFSETYVVDGSGFRRQGLEIFYSAGGMAISIATVVPKMDKKELGDLCPKCRVSGTFVRMSLVCPVCHKFLGGC